MEQVIFKIVVTGPESSGKTTLATDLALALGCPCVPEFARPYVGHLGRPYAYTDLEKIARGQQLWEQWWTNRLEQGLLICDTDWTVLRIWERYKFGTTAVTTPPPDLAPLYLLCAPDFAWQPDPLREHPEERLALFDLYLDLLRTSGANYQVLKGDPQHRRQTALQLIAKYY